MQLNKKCKLLTFRINYKTTHKLRTIIKIDGYKNQLRIKKVVIKINSKSIFPIIMFYFSKKCLKFNKHN